MNTIPLVPVCLSCLPEIAQCGLCVHGARVAESHTLPRLWSLHVYHYVGSLTVAGARHGFAPGWASLLPPGVEGQWEFPPLAPHYYAHFSLPGCSGPETRVPLLRDMGAEADRLSQAMDEMAGFFPSQPQRAAVRLWDLLYCYADTRAGESRYQPLPPAVQMTLTAMHDEQCLDKRIGEVARQNGISHNQLLRLFKRHFGCGVAEYFRREKIARAKQLIAGTKLPIKSIAAECGFPSIRYFNKCFRAATGQTPSAWRVAAPPAGASNQAVFHPPRIPS